MITRNTTEKELVVQEDEKTHTHTAIVWDTVKKPEFEKLNSSYLQLKIKRM
jgi:hypothetical protein